MRQLNVTRILAQCDYYHRDKCTLNSMSITEIHDPLLFSVISYLIDSILTINVFTIINKLKKYV